MEKEELMESGFRASTPFEELDKSGAKVIHVFLNPNLTSLNPELGWSEFITNKPTAIHYTHKNSLKDFYVQDYNQHETVREIAQWLAKSSEGTLVPLRDPQVGDLCLAPYERKPFRAEVIEKCPDDARFSRVLYIDFGNTNIVHNKYLCKMPGYLMNIPRQVSNMRWDVAVAEEVGESNWEYLERKSIVAKKKLGPGQYMAAFGNHPIFDHEIVFRYH